MKVKNIKVGVRVHHKGTGTDPHMKGALGTCLEADNVPYVHWDNEDFNTTSYNGTPCYAEVRTCLKRVKG